MVEMPSRNDAQGISVADAQRLFADWKEAASIVIAVSGGPDSMALLWLAARWRARFKKGPRLFAVTVDHGLRKESSREARLAKALAQSLNIEHRTLRWTGEKPATGLQAAARKARYDLLVKAARRVGASCIFTAHTRDDQAETLIMRLSRGSGLVGLAAMARESQRDGVTLARPLLDIEKVQLVATLRKAGIAYAEDPSNFDPRFTRPRLRALMPALATEGMDARNLARLSSRLARANAALDVMTEGAERYLARMNVQPDMVGFDISLFSRLSDEIRVRLLLRMIDRAGLEGPAELGKVESLLEALDDALSSAKSRVSSVRFKRTLAGAAISIERGRLIVVAAPKRKR